KVGPVKTKFSKLLFKEESGPEIGSRKLQRIDRGKTKIHLLKKSSAEVAAVEFCVDELDPGKLSVSTSRGCYLVFAEVTPGRHRSVKTTIGNDCLHKAGFGHVSAAKRCLGKGGAFEFGFLKFCTVQNSAGQIRFHQIGSGKLSVLERCLASL